MTNGPDGAFVAYVDLKPGYVIDEKGINTWLVIAVEHLHQSQRVVVTLLSFTTFELDQWDGQFDFQSLSLGDDLWDENGDPIVENYGSSNEKVHQVV